MKELRLKIQKNGIGMRFYFDKVLQTIFNLNIGDEFTVEMKTVKGVKTIILKEVQNDN